MWIRRIPTKTTSRDGCFVRYRAEGVGETGTPRPQSLPDTDAGAVFVSAVSDVLLQYTSLQPTSPCRRPLHPVDSTGFGSPCRLTSGISRSVLSVCKHNLPIEQGLSVDHHVPGCSSNFIATAAVNNSSATSTPPPIQRQQASRTPIKQPTPRIPQTHPPHTTRLVRSFPFLVYVQRTDTNLL